LPAIFAAPDLVVAGTHDDVAGETTDAFVDRLRADVARAVRHVCPGWLADQADDLTQIATTRVLDRMRETSGSVTFTAGYVYRAAYSALIDEIRKRRRLREVPLEPDLMALPAAGDPERQAGARSTRETIAACLAALMVSRRRAVTLHLQGHSFGEIAALLSCPKKKVENLVYRGLADLRTCLTTRGVSP
jgi:RNA polymerase sigma-70 factor (ECF subfamily)